MHELSIVIEVFRLVEEIAEEQGLKKINSVTVEIGELSGILEDYFRECWNVARLSSNLENTEVKIISVSAVARCKCGCEYNMTENNRICPKCKRTEYEITAGRDFVIKEIEAC